MSDEVINWQARAKAAEKDRDEWAGMYALCNKREAEALARAEAAEARVKVLEEALRKIAKGEYHNEEEDYQSNSQCSCADVVAQAALAAKEKP